MARVDTDVFLVESAGRLAVFAPLRGVIAEVPSGLMSNGRGGGGTPAASPSLAAFLKRLGLIVEDHKTTPRPVGTPSAAFAPTGVVFMVTAACNLRCEYCYADAGDHVVEHFDHEMAVDAARLVVDNAADQATGEAYLNFHGGGEPTLDFEFIRDVVTRAREYAATRAGRPVKVLASMVTNGVVPRHRLEWIAANIDSIQVSYDGPDDVHDRQRPTLHGGPSARLVRESILYLQGRVPDLLIKSTISAASVDRMPEIAEHLCSTFEIPRFHFGPVLGAGRGRFPQFGEPDPQQFIDGFIKARAVAERHGRTIVVSAVERTFPRIRRTFCGITDPNFALTAQGEISACYEVMYEADPRSGDYFFGHYDKESHRFVVDADRVAEIRRHDVNDIPQCQKCFAKWQCGGDCQIRFRDSVSGEQLTGLDARCVINRELVRMSVYKELDRVHTGGA